MNRHLAHYLLLDHHFVRRLVHHFAPIVDHWVNRSDVPETQDRVLVVQSLGPVVPGAIVPLGLTSSFL